MTSTNSTQLFVFAYPDFVNGHWIDADNVDDLQDAIEALQEKDARFEKYEEFGIADTDDDNGLMGLFIGKHGAFDFDGYMEVRDSGEEPEAIKAYIDIFGEFDAGLFEEAWSGDWSSSSDPELDFTYELVDSCYNLEKEMGSLASYFDYERFKRDLFISDYTEMNGHIFRNI